MRISDWSSDVCSSDLNRRGGGPALTPAVGAHRHHQRVAVDANLELIDQLALALGTRAGRPADRQPNQIRTAPCRESVCPYVWLSEVAVSLNKTKSLNND